MPHRRVCIPRPHQRKSEDEGGDRSVPVKNVEVRDALFGEERARHVSMEFPHLSCESSIAINSNKGFSRSTTDHQR